MRDFDFLLWIYERLAFVFDEGEHADYMIHLRRIIANIPPDQRTSLAASDVDYQTLLIMKFSIRE